MSEPKEKPDDNAKKELPPLPEFPPNLVFRMGRLPKMREVIDVEIKRVKK